MKRNFSKISPLGLVLCLSILVNLVLLLTLYRQYRGANGGSSLTNRWINRYLYNLSLPRQKERLVDKDYDGSLEVEDPLARHYTLAILISSAPGYLTRRDAVRRTWMRGYSNPPRKFFSKFVIGIGDLDKETIQKLREENSKYHDMILLPDLADQYQNLAYKTLAGLVWFDKYLNYLYVLKCDDDTFVTPDRIEDELLKREPSRGLYWGYFAGGNRPFKTGKWAEPNWKFCDTYFPYAYGGGYVLSADVVRRIAAHADALIVYNNEDVSVGAWTVIYEMERKHDVRFDSSYSRGCKNNFMTTHQPNLKNFEEKHELFRTTGTLCVKEGASENHYNWNMPPSRCYHKS